MDLVIDFIDCPQQTLDQREQTIKEQLLLKCSQAGEFTTALVHSLWIEGVLSVARHAQRIFRLADTYGYERLEAACRRAMFYREPDYLTVERILQLRIENLPLDPYCDVYGQLALWPADVLDECGVPINP